MRLTFVIGCCAGLLLLAAGARAQTGKSPAPPQPAAAQAAQLPPDHGGKIESKYDGFSHETVVALKKMGVNCGGAKGVQGFHKSTCISIAASLHCPGKQLDYVRRATLQIVFEAKDWDSRHPFGERGLSVVADGETLKLGEMRLAGQGVGTGWLDEKAREVFEVSVPYEVFRKIALAQRVEMSIGRSAFELREKNVAALRDLNNRVRF